MTPTTHIEHHFPAEDGEMIEFRLLYSGSLLGASRHNTRAPLKHEIRKEFEPQLRRLWTTNTQLQHYAKAVYGSYREREMGVPMARSQEEMVTRGMQILATQWNRNGFNFLPIVTEQLCMCASLEILFMRPNEPGLLIESGDLDNRVKTIFDALRMPKNLDELAGDNPAKDQRFFCCLLEDDKLISEIRVTTDQLLLLPKSQDIHANDVFLVVHAKLVQTDPKPDKWRFY